MIDDLRNYLQMASGLTDATTAKAKDVVSGLLSTGLSLSTRAMPAPDMVDQVQVLADDLVATSKNNREALTGLIRSEVDKAVGRMGFVREDELAALRRHVQRLERQLADVEASVGPASGEHPAVVIEESAAVVVVDSDPAVEPPAQAADAEEPPSPEAAAPSADAVSPPKKKKKVIVDPSAGA